MALLLFVAFIAVPILELAVIVEVGSYIGTGPTIVLLVADSVAGAWLVKREGRRAWDAVHTALSRGNWPGDEVVQGALVLAGGALLLTPGFVTDVVGLLAVLPPTRALASRTLRSRFTPTSVHDATRLFERKEAERRRARSGGASGRSSSNATQAGSGGESENGRSGRRSDGQVLDVEVVSVERDRREQDTSSSK